jgi:hypothetical protein
VRYVVAREQTRVLRERQIADEQSGYDLRDVPRVVGVRCGRERVGGGGAPDGECGTSGGGVDGERKRGDSVEERPGWLVLGGSWHTVVEVVWPR